jgi:TonB family protein
MLHEEAHRRRFEPLRYGIQRLVFCLLFYFPPLWLLLRQLHDTAELACDEAALENGIHPDAYLSTLRKVVALDLVPAGTLAAMAGARPSSFAKRLSHIQTYKRRSVMLRHRLALIAGVAVLSASVFVAGTPDKKPVPVPAGENGVTTPVRTVDSVALPVYPEMARKSRVDGTVVLQATIQTNGNIDQLSVLKEDPKEFGFGESAMEAVRQWRYEPAFKDGEPVAVYMMIHVKFKLDNNKPDPEPSVS